MNTEYVAKLIVTITAQTVITLLVGFGSNFYLGVAAGLYVFMKVGAYMEDNT